MKRIIMLCLVFFLILCGGVFADTLFLKNGSQLKGQVVRHDAEKVTFRIGEGEDSVEATFFNDEVLRIDKEEISNFITLPFGQSQQIDIPRPIFNQEPMVSEQAKTQQKQRGQTELPEQANETVQDMYNQIEAEQPTMALEPLPESIKQDLNDQDASLSEELSQLLNPEEQDYFSKINSITQGIGKKMFSVLPNSSGSAPDQDTLDDLAKDMPSEIQDIIEEIKVVQAPELFVDFQEKYLDNLSLMKEVMGNMAKGEIANSQSKIEDLQNMNAELKAELEKILEIKKNQ
ncbi:MAG: hypothetical protein ABIA97_06475 [Candidatus Omnitrophota bacterium]